MPAYKPSAIMTPKKTKTANDGPPAQVSSGVDTRAEIVPLVRNWLEKGISTTNLRSSVRIQDITELAGGLKSPVVGVVNVSVQVIIKQGSDELIDHQRMMNIVNDKAAKSKSSKLQAAVFPEVMAVQELAGMPKDRNYIMIQQAFVGYDSVQDLLYGKNASIARAKRAVDRGLPALEFIHRITQNQRGPLKDLPRTPDPFTSRLERLRKLKGQHTWLEQAFRSETIVDGHKLPRLTTLLHRLRKWQATRSKENSLRLVHGDPHIANLMTRRRGRDGESARWIDPNPTVGFSDPAYDWGKLLHFVEPVGWAKESDGYVTTKIRESANGVKINTALQGYSKRVENARAEIEQQVRSAALAALKHRSQPEAILELSIASAHIGYASLGDDPNATRAQKKATERRRQYALALTLRALARWHAAAYPASQQCESANPTT